MQYLKLNILQICLLVFVFSTLFTLQIAFAETEMFTVAARDYELKYIPLKEGDEIEYSVRVSGGNNDDMEFTIYDPNGNDDGGGMIYDLFEDGFTARVTGTYTFEFNTPSIITNKNVKFSYEITKNVYFIYVDELPDYANHYAGNAVYQATEFWKEILPKKQFYIAETIDDADIIISWVRDFGGFNDHLGYQYIRLIEVGLGDSNCYGIWKEYDSNYLTTIMAHEIGHAIGFEHSDDPNDLMYPQINPDLEIYGSPCVSPQPPKSGGGCLIATATFDSELAPQVQLLRELRDNKLLQTESGINFMNIFNNFYYLFSPHIADYERANPMFKEMVKIAITPMISSLSILNSVDMDSEELVLVHGTSLILLNIVMYFATPVIVIIGIKKKRKVFDYLNQDH